MSKNDGGSAMTLDLETYFAQHPANGDAELPPLPDRFDSVSVDDFTGHRLSVYTASQMEAYARAAIAALQQRVTPLALPEVTDEDESAAWDVLLITGQPIDSCACDGDMRKVLESYRARLMAKVVPND